jgi:hypothetical protein
MYLLVTRFSSESLVEVSPLCCFGIVVVEAICHRAEHKEERGSDEGKNEVGLSGVYFFSFSII